MMTLMKIYEGMGLINVMCTYLNDILGLEPHIYFLLARAKMHFGGIWTALLRQ